MKKEMGRKAQLTIFIIIGIVLLFSTALIIYIKQSIVEYKPPVEIAFEQVPAEMQPLQNYVTNCLESTAKDALIKLGMQGGYVDASSLIVNDEDPTAGDGIAFSGLKIPYWHYMKSQNTCNSECEFDYKRPELHKTTGKGNSVEEQISKYVEQKLSSCLKEFYPFKSQGFEIEQSAIKARTTIARTDVVVQAEYPLKVKRAGAVHTMSKFTAQLPINLGKFYDFASVLVQKEASNHSLGLLTMNLIDGYSGVDESKLPPVADTTFFRGKTTTWMLGKVKADIEEILTIHSNALQAEGALNYIGNFYEGNDPLGKGLYSMFIIPSDKLYSMRTDFTYLSEWPIYLKITPSDGELIRPDSASGFSSVISFLGVNQYKFAYDVSYPMLITLSDPEAFDGEGYVFQFAVEVNIRNNEYISPETVLLSYSSLSRSTMACRPENYNSGEITVDVSDSITKEPVDKALVYLSFGKESCFIGETAVENGKAVLKSKMPVGIGALIISKDDYVSKAIPFWTRLDAKDKVSAELDKIVELDVSIERLPVVKTGYDVNVDMSSGAFSMLAGGPVSVSPQWSIMPAVPGLEPTQKAVVSFIRIPENDAEEEFSSFAEIKGDDAEKKKIRLAPGNYQVTGNLFDNQKTIIPEDEMCYADDVYDYFGMGKKKCEKIEAVSFEVFPKGGVSIDNFAVTGDDMKDAKEIVVKLFAAPDGYARSPDGVTNLKLEDLEQLGKTDEYSKNYPDLVRPVFIK